MSAALMDIKEAISQLLNALPNIPQNAGVRSRAVQLLNAREIVRRPFIYILPFTGASAPAAGANITLNINVDSSADFLWQAGCYAADIAGAAQTANTRVIPNASVLITDQSGAGPMSDNDVPITSIFGIGQEPFILPEPKVLLKNSVLSVRLTSFETANLNNIRLAFIGCKLLAYGG